MNAYWWVKRLALILGLPVVMVVALFGFAFSQSSVPQDAAAAAALYKIPQESLFAVVDSGSGQIVGWKVESSTLMTMSVPAGACVDYPTSMGTPSGDGMVAHSKLEDWSRWQVSGTVSALVSRAATIYMGRCGPMVELTATITADPSMNIRKAPSTTSKILGKALLGQVWFVQARTTDAKWVYAINAVHMGGWLYADYVAINGDKMALPEANVVSPAP